MIPSDVSQHDPKLLLRLANNPPAEHGKHLNTEEQAAYKWLLKYGFLKQRVVRSKTSDEGGNFYHDVDLNHTVYSGKISELQSYLGE